MTFGAGLRNGFGTLVAAAFTAVVTDRLQREQRARAELAGANAQLRGFAAQAERLATTQERNRLARDIHDGLGHHLTVVQLQFQAARAVLAADPARDDGVLAKAQQQATEALVEVRHSVSVLREPRERVALAAALEALAAQTSGAGVPTELWIAGSVRTLPVEVEESLFRVAQEGLTNVRKHAEASRAELILDFAGAGSVRLEVREDGAGVDPAADPDAIAGFGILGLRERTARLSGRLDLESTPGQGTNPAGGGPRMTAAVRVLLVDDQALFREALGTLLSVRPEVVVVGEAENGDEAVRQAALLRPDVVLMDLHMPLLDGIAATRRLRAEQPEVRVLALTTFDDDEDVFEALRAGAVGYLLKDVSSQRLVEALLAAARGESRPAAVGGDKGRCPVREILSIPVDQDHLRDRLVIHVPV